ncbi:MAG: hypothetical protein H0U49_12700 [Parachlamydiaceae bacterium]|nr:hypothetical protein [Parachlamydiaceae bacterium]
MQTSNDLNRFDIRYNINLNPSSLLVEEQSAIAETINTISTYISDARAATGSNLMEERKRLYGLAFSELYAVAKDKGSLPKELHPKLFELLHRYASDVRYNQGENGFSDCAKLMRLSLNLQCKDLGLIDFDFNLQDTANFEELMANYQDQYDTGIFYDQSYVSKIGSALFHNPEMREMLGETLIQLSFSYQNMPQIQDKNKNKAFQTVLNEMTLAVLPKDTLSQIERLAFFLYNRCSFMEALNHADTLSKECKEAQILSYQPIEELYMQKFGIDSPVYQAKLSQIENMRGLLVLRMKDYDHNVALKHFRLAIDSRMQISEPKGVEEKWSHHFLLNNIRTGLIHELLQQPTQENIQEACIHGKEIALFVEANKNEGRDPSYNTSYFSTLLKLATHI